MKKTILLFLGLAISLPLLRAQTTVPPLITTDQVWDISGSPYQIGQNTFVDTGVSILVRPGVEIVSTGKHRLDINGEFQAIGKWDSLVRITGVEISFTAKSTDYSSQTGRGAFFRYCYFTGNGSGYRTISATTTSLRIDRCEFVNSYYTIYMQSGFPRDTVVTYISDSKFSGDTYGNGSPLNGNIMESKLTVERCLFAQTSNIYTYGQVTYKNNTFRKMRKLTAAYMFGDNIFSCNRFTDMAEGIHLDASGYNTKGRLFFKDNTLDSIGTNAMSFYPNLLVTRPMSSYPQFGYIEVSGNNFLLNRSTAVKVALAGTNQNPLSTDTVNFRDNYWGSTDPAVIAGYIKDYSDDVYIHGRADFSAFKSTPAVGCSYNPSCAKAYFEFSVSDSMAVFTDKSAGSKPYRIRWVFGDGKSDQSNSKTVTHAYDKPGTYQACIYVYDTLENLCDSFCRPVLIKSKARCEAGFYFAVDTADTKVVYIVNTSKGTNSLTRYYWTFGDGTGSNAVNPVHTYSQAGKYGVCVTIFDTAAACYSAFCDSVIISAPGITLFVIDEDDITALRENKTGTHVKIWPNPGSGMFYIDMPFAAEIPARVAVTDVRGRVVFAGDLQGDTSSPRRSLDLSSLENGLYLITIRSGAQTANLRICIEHP